MSQNPIQHCEVFDIWGIDFEFYDLLAIRYFNCYRAYIDLMSSDSDHELRYNLYLRMQVYYELLEEIFDSIYE